MPLVFDGKLEEKEQKGSSLEHVSSISRRCICRELYEQLSIISKISGCNLGVELGAWWRM